MLQSRYNVENPKDESEIKAEPCPKPPVKAEPCQPLAKQASPMKVEANSPPKFAPQEASVVTIFDEDLLSSHSADVLTISMDSSLHDEEDDYEEFPPTQLCERGICRGVLYCAGGGRGSVLWSHDVRCGVLCCHVVWSGVMWWGVVGYRVIGLAVWFVE